MNENALETIKGLLSNPDARNMLMNLMGSLATPTDTKPEVEMPEVKPTPMAEQPIQQAPPPMPTAESPTRISLDETMNKMFQIKQAYDKVNAQPDSRISLLTALKPYLNSKRMSKVDTAIQMVQLTKISKMFQDM